jgi:hypothetical protein
MWSGQGYGCLTLADFARAECRPAGVGDQPMSRYGGPVGTLADEAVLALRI